MSDLFSSLLIFTIIKTILSTFFFTVSNFHKNLVKWALTEIESSVAGTTTIKNEIYGAQKKQETQMCQKRCVHIYGYIIYCSYVLMRNYLMHSIRKSFSEACTCITLLCNYYCFFYKKGGN
jgi:cation transport ATPase